MLRFAALIGLLAFGWQPTAQANSPAEGRAVFEDQCADCHTVTPGKHKRGPSLAGVLGRQAAAQPNYNYSNALRSAGIVWTPERLTRYLSNPKQDVPGGKMRLLTKPSQSELTDLLAWLQQAR